MTNQSNKGELVVSDKTVSLSSPKDMMEFAATLKHFIIKEKLFTEIKGKNFVEVEGWQFCGAALGILPVVKDLVDLSTEKEIKYKATIELKRMTDGEVMGAGVALCSNKEAKRGNADEYVIASMAQTRATGKAYRNGFGWLMKIAGYEATPADEVRNIPLDDDHAGTDVINQLPLEDIKEKVVPILDNLPTHERLKAMKKYGKLTDKSLTEYDWRGLYMDLVEGRNLEEDAPDVRTLPGDDQDA